MTDPRQKILGSLLSELKGNPKVDAIWEAGSAATGTSDKFSDLDLVVVSSENSDLLFKKIDSILKRDFVITHYYNETPSACEGYDQRIYYLDKMPKHFFLDIGVLDSGKTSTLSELLEVEKHGTPVVHFDKNGIVKPTKIEPSHLQTKHAQKLKDLESTFPIVRTSVMKALDRGQHVEAFTYYFSSMLKRYIDLLGIKYRPHRYDFGMRYTSRDFPKEIHSRIKEYTFVSNPSQLIELAPRLNDDFYELLNELKQTP